MKKLFLFLTLFAIALSACDVSEPADLAPMQTQIAELQVEVDSIQQEINDLALVDLWNYVDNIYNSVLDLWDEVDSMSAEPIEVEYTIFGSDGRLMNDGAVQLVRSHLVGDDWILEFHIANFFEVNVADYFVITPTNPLPSGWVGSSVGTCYADPADRPQQVSGAALWKRPDFTGAWGIICAWDDIDGVALNLWGKTNANHLFSWVNRTGTEFVITVPWH